MKKDLFYGALIAGDLHGAMDLLDEAERASYEARFVQREKIPYPVEPPLDRILDAYQDHWRTVFWLKAEGEEALRNALADILAADRSLSLEQLEDGPVQMAFERKGLHFLGGKTGGVYGPYVWRTSRDQSFAVELPEGITEYTVRFLEGFVVKSWLDWLSFGAIGTGGWTQDGRICCVADSYDVESENFQVSLLKHEAQHTRDLARWPAMDAETLEYRAKLVELIYSKERDLLAAFKAQAGAGNAHALAAKRIAESIRPEDDVSGKALKLFWESCKEWETR